MSLEVEPRITSGDYLDGFLLGTRAALYESNRQSITITVPVVRAFEVGALIALFERTVGLYASLVNVNAYHQPGVEAGKKAATTVIALIPKIIEYLNNSRLPHTATQIAREISTDDIETVFKICEHLSMNARPITRKLGATPFEATYQYIPG